MQATAHLARSRYSVTSRHGRISNRSPDQKNVVNKNRAHSSTNRAGTSREEAERIKEPWHANGADNRRVTGVNMQRLAHPRGIDSVTSSTLQKIKPQISRIRASRRGSAAAEKAMLDAAPATFRNGVAPSSGRWRLGDANLAMRTRTEPMQRKRVPRQGGTERKLARRDTRKGTQAELETPRGAGAGGTWKESNGEG
jgi:hypothetical protein